MGLYNINHIRKELKGVFDGQRSTVYTKIKNLMDGYIGTCSKYEVQKLRALLKKASDEADKKLKKIESEL